MVAEGSKHQIKIRNCRFLASESFGLGGTVFVEGCSFVMQNTAMQWCRATFGGSAVHMEVAFQQMLSGSIEDASIINCTASTMFLASYNIRVSNTSMDITDDTANPHIMLKGDFVALQSFGAIIKYPKTVQSNTIQNIIIASSLENIPKISDSFSVTCSPNFNIEIESNQLMAVKGFHVRCVSCPPSKYIMTLP